MDPFVCWATLLAAQEEGDKETMQECIGNLTTWIRSGGFMPVLSRADFIQVLQVLNRSL